MLRRQVDHHGWTAVAVDGKSLRGDTGEHFPTVHVVAAYVHEARVVLANLGVDAETNDHKAASELLGMLPLKGQSSPPMRCYLRRLPPGNP